MCSLLIILSYSSSLCSFIRLLKKGGCNSISDYYTRLDVLNKTFNPRFVEAKRALKRRNSIKKLSQQRQQKKNNRIPRFNNNRKVANKEMGRVTAGSIEQANKEEENITQKQVREIEQRVCLKVTNFNSFICRQICSCAH